jgi:hypothetical protein
MQRIDRHESIPSVRRVRKDFVGVRENFQHFENSAVLLEVLEYKRRVNE